MTLPKPLRLVTVALLAGAAALLWSGDGSLPSGSLISRAEARVGRPATPMSYAGVARRTTRRGVAYGAAAGAAAAGAPASQPASSRPERGHHRRREVTSRVPRSR